MQYHNELIAALDALAAERSPLQHPFYLAWTAGTLSMSRLREYAVQYYIHVAAFPRYLSALHSRCEDLETRQTILENLIETRSAVAIIIRNSGSGSPRGSG